MTSDNTTNLRDMFQQPFNMDAWYNCLQHIFCANELLATPEHITESATENGYYLGCLDTEDSYHIGFFLYNISKGSVANKRVGLRNLVKPMLRYQFDAALVIFDSGDHWRLSFISDIKGDATSPKRYTYVFGNDELLYKTPIERFYLLQRKGVSYENLKTAFSVEALSDEFFNKYREQYADFVQYVTGKRFVKAGNKWEEKVLSEPNAQLIEAFDHNDKKVRDYIKKMMGRITFLHFLQRKGWMCGDLNYMQNLFNRSQYQDDYLDSVLEPLFFGILNTKPEKRDALFEGHKWDKSLLNEWRDIPYLNGGLFERDEDDEPDSVFPAKYFKGLFQFFSEYNFTIDENDPNDAEVGVDPEMLGKIFENLLEDNKDKGAFYTPKEIVRYMCQESLIAYLNTNTSIATDKIRKFVLLPEEGVVDIPENKKDKLLAALENVKICDPAIGSGAFPMGLLNELLHCREVLSGEHYDRAEIKKSIIKNNIYGVDIEKGAVDIARLRFWLSIVVDEETPSPLPNLDYKIMQGNSLMESFMGVDLSKLTYDKEGKKDSGEWSLFDDETNKQQKLVSQLLSEYYSCYDHDQKVRIQQQISDTINKQLETQSYNEAILGELKSINSAENNQFFLWHTWFSDVFGRDNDKKGFDIVIGNPPYIQLQNNGGELANLYDGCHFQTFTKTGDIYCLFYEKGWQLLCPQGHLCFITSNKWMRAAYGEKIRGFFAKNANPKCLVDFAGVKIFDNATVDTNILILSKENNEHQTKCAITDKLNKESLKDLSNFVQQNSTICDFNTSDSWVILSPVEQSIKSKIEAVGTPLKDWDIQINYGIKTGFNDAFIISTEKRNEILNNCFSEEEKQKTAELIRPILRGRDIKRYGYNWANLWLVWIPWHFPLHLDKSIEGASEIAEQAFMEQYPAVYNHLLQYKQQLSARNKAETGIRYEWYAMQRWGANYWEDFNKPKIVYGQFQDGAEYSFAEEGMYVSSNEYILISPSFSPKSLLALLNCKASEWLLGNITGNLGGNAKIGQKSNFLKLSIVKLTEELQHSLDSIVDDILIKQKRCEDTIELEKGIDKIIYKVYGFTDQEIKEIERL